MTFRVEIEHGPVQPRTSLDRVRSLSCCPVQRFSRSPSISDGFLRAKDIAVPIRWRTGERDVQVLPRGRSGIMASGRPCPLSGAGFEIAGPPMMQCATRAATHRTKTTNAAGRNDGMTVPAPISGFAALGRAVQAPPAGAAATLTHVTGAAATAAPVAKRTTNTNLNDRKGRVL